jgi:hypothetical protein
MGNFLKAIINVCKICILFCSYNSENMRDKLNYGIIRFYSCNNRVIDTIQNGGLKLTKHVTESCDENYTIISEFVTKKIIKYKSN